jgi:hypothetical protein
MQKGRVHYSENRGAKYAAKAIMRKQLPKYERLASQNQTIKQHT